MSPPSAPGGDGNPSASSPLTGTREADTAARTTWAARRALLAGHLRWRDSVAPSSINDLAHLPVESDLRRKLARLNGENRFVTVLSALPDGYDMQTCDRSAYRHFTGWLQAGGSADRMILRVARTEADGERETYTVGRSAPDTSRPPAERVNHGVGWDDVYPQELWTTEEAIAVFAYYMRNDQALPEGPNLRLFGYEPSEFGRREGY